MPTADEQLPPDEWLTLSDAERAAAKCRAAKIAVEAETSGLCPVKDSSAAIESAKPDDDSSESQPITIVPITVERAYRIAESLDFDDRLKLAALIWKSLPTKERSRLVSFQFESAANYQPAPAQAQEASSAFGATWMTTKPIDEMIWQLLFDPANTSQLYSAPRRFDLATIFVVTAAYSLLFGIMTALGATPVLKIMLGGLVTIVAVAQALFLKVVNPRGVSIVAGAAAHTVISLIAYYAEPYFYLNSLLVIFLVVFINGIIGGSIMGYLAGVLVGGVFLVADKLRTKLGRPPDDVEPHISSDAPV